jgi:hypothetical protein
VRSYVAVALIAFAACKGKPQHRPPPPTRGADVAVAPGSDGQRAAPDLALPQGPGTPPLKTTRKLGRADFEKMAKLEFPGFERELHGLNDAVFEVRQKTKDHPTLWAVVTIEPCDAGSAAGSAAPSAGCWAMNLADWKTHLEELRKQTVPDELQGSDVDFELGAALVHGTMTMGTYQVGVAAGSGAGGTMTDAYYLYFNDGINKIRVAASYKDKPVATKQQLIQLAPKQDLALLAASFLDVYTHAWGTN